MITLLTWSSSIALWLVCTCSLTFALLPYESTNPITANLIVTCLLFFNNLNIFIAICEINLGKHIMFIKKDYQQRLKKYGRGREWDSAFDLLAMPLTVKEVFDGRTWALMWSAYAMFDPSYQNYESFGFWIDVGNGLSTIPSCLFLNYAMIYPDKVSPVVLGCVVVASYWQILYGTVVYFMSFFYNKRYEGRSNAKSIIAFVIIVNGVWFMFPSMAIYAAYSILRDGDLSIFEL